MHVMRAIPNDLTGAALQLCDRAIKEATALLASRGPGALGDFAQSLAALPLSFGGLGIRHARQHGHPASVGAFSLMATGEYPIWTYAHTRTFRDQLRRAFDGRPLPTDPSFRFVVQARHAWITMYNHFPNVKTVADAAVIGVLDTAADKVNADAGIDGRADVEADDGDRDAEDKFVYSEKNYSQAFIAHVIRGETPEHTATPEPGGRGPTQPRLQPGQMDDILKRRTARAKTARGITAAGPGAHLSALPAIAASDAVGGKVQRWLSACMNRLIWYTLMKGATDKQKTTMRMNAAPASYAHLRSLPTSSRDTKWPDDEFLYALEARLDLPHSAARGLPRHCPNCATDIKTAPHHFEGACNARGRNTVHKLSQNCIHARGASAGVAAINETKGNIPGTAKRPADVEFLESIFERDENGIRNPLPAFFDQTSESCNSLAVDFTSIGVHSANTSQERERCTLITGAAASLAHHRKLSKKVVKGKPTTIQAALQHQGIAFVPAAHERWGAMTPSFRNIIKHFSQVAERTNGHDPAYFRALWTARFASIYHRAVAKTALNHIRSLARRCGTTSGPYGTSAVELPVFVRPPEHDRIRKRKRAAPLPNPPSSNTAHAPTSTNNITT